MVRKYTHIIWDWNGTLLDDVWLCVDILNGIMTKRHMAPITAEQYRAVFGFPVRDYYTKLGFDFTREPFEQIADEYIDSYNRRRFECKLHDGTTEVLNVCAENGLTQSILSAYPQQMLEEFVDAFGLRRFFVALSGRKDHFATGKTRQAEQLLGQLDGERAKTLLVGDTTHDFDVAQAVDIDCVLVAAGHQMPERLRDCGAPVLGSMRQVPRWLASQRSPGE